MKSKNKKINNPIIKPSKGFTLIEVIVATAIMAVVLIFIGGFSLSVIDFKNFVSPVLEVQGEVNQSIQEIGLYLRTMNYSNLGAYPIVAAGTSTMTFFSDTDEDGLAEQVRYFLNGNIFKKGVIKPSGNPLTYNPANEKITEIIHGVVSGSTSTIFSYYDANYTGAEPAMAYPVDISKIKIVGVDVAAKQTNQKVPITASIKIKPRNLNINQ